MLDPSTSELVNEDPMGLCLIIRIFRDSITENLWKEMKSKMITFWNEEMGPEIVDPRKTRGMPFRQSEARQKAIAGKTEKLRLKKSVISKPMKMDTSSNLSMRNHSASKPTSTGSFATDSDSD